MKLHRWLIVLASLFLASCGATPAPTSVSAPLFILITSAPNASPTPTPFQPPVVLQSQATPTSFYFIQVPTLEPFFPTETSSPTPIPPPQPTATVDLNSLFPTEAAPPPSDSSGQGPAPQSLLTNKDTINFLLIGSDKPSGGSFRTDTMILVVLWLKEGQASMISIPRDLWIYIPTVGMQRINTAYELGNLDGYPNGGSALLKDTIAYNLGIQIDHTAMVQFDGFSRIVDTLGGIDVPVSCPYTDWHLIDPSYDPNNPDNWNLYTVQPGIVHMDGSLALWYARSRLHSNDFDRGRRQQEVLRAILAQALKTDTLSRIPQLYADLSSAISTDLSLADILKLALYAPKLSNFNIRSYYIRPPYVTDWITPGGADVLLPNQPALEQMLADATTLSTTAVQRQTNSIEVENGTPFNGWDTLAASRLNYAGYNTTISTADRQNYSNSMLFDMTTAQDPSARTTILNSLGLYSASVVSMPNPNSPIQYRLVLGYDYQPCFQPQDLSH